jgi:peptidoglycan/xylan/chitin deacetylase (PgdA/CDA1 family)
MIMVSGCAHTPEKQIGKSDDYKNIKAEIVKEYATRTPAAWGENINGVITRFDTDDNKIALTLDACGGPEGSGFNVELIDYLIEANIPATLFINARWIDANPLIFELLAVNPLFEIENHGLNHKPCSATGKSAYKIVGTSDIKEMIDEIEIPARKIEAITGRKPIYYRPGTANCDDICVEVAARLGYKIIGFSINGDYGATADSDTIYEQLLSAVPGDIVLMHMNHAASLASEGLMKAVPELKHKGFDFVRLSDVLMDVPQGQGAEE